MRGVPGVHIIRTALPIGLGLRYAPATFEGIRSTTEN